ncbi:MAG: methyltransferase domain-containing protein [Thermodesulfovibrionia bacterium]|nr:methyltransferase domain-containing protein [Thermodesulfovibrionia bacterium]
MKILDVGCGKNKTDGAIGIDFSSNTGVDIVHDLNTFPYPFSNDVFDKVIVKNVIEHLNDIVKVMEEIHRISKNGAEVIITTPHFSSLYSWEDPTHKYHLALDSFDYFTENTKHTNFYSNKRFEVLEKKIDFGKSLLSIISRFIFLLSKHKYEKHFAFLFPANQLYFRLKVLKK